MTVTNLLSDTARVTMATGGVDRKQCFNFLTDYDEESSIVSTNTKSFMGRYNQFSKSHIGQLRGCSHFKITKTEIYHQYLIFQDFVSSRTFHVVYQNHEKWAYKVQ
jgi:hypothetical protein